MEPVNRKIQALVDMFINQELLLPEMQRKYVWRATQVRDLLDSVYRDYPSGSILIWETDNIPEVKSHNIKKGNQSPIGKRLLLLDGQQRITSLASIITGHPIRIKEGTKINEKIIDIFFNLDHPEDNNKDVKDKTNFDIGDLVEAKWDDGEFYSGKITQISKGKYYIIYDDGDEGWTDEIRDLTEETKKEIFFQILNKKIENKPNWISVTKLFKEGVGSILVNLKIGADHPKYKQYNDRLNQLYNKKEYYLYPIQIIRDKSYNEVTDIFIRVNSSGTRLRGSDLAIAQITSAWPGSIKLFENFVDKCIEKDFYLDENFLVRCMVCIASHQAKFDKMGSMKSETLKRAWDLTKKGVQNTITFLKNNALVDSSALLPSNVLMIPLVYYSCIKNLCASENVEKGFLYWFYNAAIWGRYSASMETRLTQDIAALKDKNTWEPLLENIWANVGRDRVVMEEDFRGKTTNHPLFFMMYIQARKNKARDFETGNFINYSNFGINNKIEFDHIFPKSKLEKHLKDRDNSERKKLINEISNLAFMTKTGNIIKRDDDPSLYFPKVYKKYGGDTYFKRQNIPYEISLLPYDKYEAFLNARAEILAKRTNTFLNSLKP